MNTRSINTIDDIITSLDYIISEAEKSNDTSGYFATVYQKTTLKIKDGLKNGEFGSESKIAKLTILIAKQYVKGYYNFNSNKPISLSWRKAFINSPKSHLIMLQHLMVGINAQINLDLGIAVAEVSKEEGLSDLEQDFNRIFEIFTSVIKEVHDDISSDWPTLKRLLKYAGNIDDYWYDQIIENGKSDTWRFANMYATIPKASKQIALSVRDQEVAAKTDIILKPGFLTEFILKLIRIAEKGSVSSKISRLKHSLN